MAERISLVVEDKPGMLARISTIVAHSGVNIDSLFAGPTGRPGISTVTLVVDADDRVTDLMTRKFQKLVQVLEVKTQDAPN